MHIDASLLAIGVMLTQNPNGKYGQLIVYASRLLNKVGHNYIITYRKVLAMVYVLHKFKHFLLGIKIFYLCRPHGSYIFNQQTIGV